MAVSEQHQQALPRGLMQSRPMLISDLIEYAARTHATREIVTRMGKDSIHRYTYADAAARTRQLANALTGAGFRGGDRIATLAMNTYRHFEVYYATSGIGAICHTLNPRLFEEQLVFIINDAGDRCVFVDPQFVPLAERIAPRLTTVQRWVILADEAEMPATSLPNALSYERFISGVSGHFDWPSFDENTASSLCYTSGTTGNPKGVLYSHRSTVLHAFAIAMPDVVGIAARDVIQVLVPMFHVNAWCIVYAAPMCGAKLVFMGADLSPQSTHDAMESERCTISAGVPTLWLGLLDYLERTKKSISTTRTFTVGGSAAPRSMIEAFMSRHQARVVHCWGMTELSPLGSVAALQPEMEDWPLDRKLDVLTLQGRPVYGVDLKITDDAGHELPHDGRAAGHLKARGLWVASAYYNGAGTDLFDADGWFDSGDIATIDARGYIKLTDRAKDVIKSGGEWISSIEIENQAVGHPAVAQAAVIGVAHPKWNERPLLVVVKKPGASVDREALLDHLQDKIAKWWLPDDVVFVDQLPINGTGKIAKVLLRQQFANHKLPTA